MKPGEAYEKYSVDRIQLCIEIADGLKQRGYWIPDDICSSNIIIAIFRAIDERKTE